MLYGRESVNVKFINLIQIRYNCFEPFFVSPLPCTSSACFSTPHLPLDICVTCLLLDVCVTYFMHLKVQ